MKINYLWIIFISTSYSRHESELGGEFKNGIIEQGQIV